MGYLFSTVGNCPHTPSLERQTGFVFYMAVYGASENTVIIESVFKSAFTASLCHIYTYCIYNYVPRLYNTRTYYPFVQAPQYNMKHRKV